MLDSKDWQAHARLTRSMARRAQLYGDAERARRLLDAAEEMDRRAVLAAAPCHLVPALRGGEADRPSDPAVLRTGGVVQPIRPGIDLGGRPPYPGERRPEGRPEADRPGELGRPERRRVAARPPLRLVAATPARLPSAPTA